MSHILESIEKVQESFYDSNGKNRLFKKSQKIDCAKEVSRQINIDDLLNMTVYILPGTNKVVFYYSVFKLYANPDNYDLIISYILRRYDEVLNNNNNTFEIHMSLDTFSVSAAERYKEIIRMFCEKCMNASTNYSTSMTKLYVYNSPAVMDPIMTIIKPFIDPSVKDKIVFYSKSESTSLLQKLYESVGMTYV
jgi:hypothetical protein